MWWCEQSVNGWFIFLLPVYCILFFLQTLSSDLASGFCVCRDWLDQTELEELEETQETQ